MAKDITIQEITDYSSCPMETGFYIVGVAINKKPFVIEVLMQDLYEIHKFDTDKDKPLLRINKDNVFVVCEDLTQLSIFKAGITPIRVTDKAHFITIDQLRRLKKCASICLNGLSLLREDGSLDW